MWNAKQHSYEELRNVVMDILLRKEAVSFPVNQWGHLTTGVAEVIARREKTPATPYSHNQPVLHPHDAELVRDIFWDLFRQGVITLGLNDSNPAWPWFRLSHFGEQAMAGQQPYRFHDTATYVAMVKKEVPDLSKQAQTYLEEAVAAFYADCMLASCVMLGVAAETEFLALVDVAEKGKHATSFAGLKKHFFIRKKIDAFHTALKPLIPALPHDATEDFETNLSMIQSVLRIARNDAGHPSSANPSREQVYVFLQLFAPFARQLKRLRSALK